MTSDSDASGPDPDSPDRIDLPLASACLKYTNPLGNVNKQANTPAPHTLRISLIPSHQWDRRTVSLWLYYYWLDISIWPPLPPTNVRIRTNVWMSFLMSSVCKRRLQNSIRPTVCQHIYIFYGVSFRTIRTFVSDCSVVQMELPYPTQHECVMNTAYIL